MIGSYLRNMVVYIRRTKTAISAERKREAANADDLNESEFIKQLSVFRGNQVNVRFLKKVQIFATIFPVSFSLSIR